MHSAQTLILDPFAGWARRQARQHKKALTIVILSGVAWLAGDHLMEYVTHVLHMLVEVLESLFDQFFAEVVGLSHHEAEVVTAYTGFTIFLFLGYHGARKIRTLLQRAYAAAYQRCTEWAASPRGIWLMRNRYWLLSGVIGLAVAYFFGF